MNSVIPTHGVSHRHFADARGLASAARISLAFCSSVAGFLLASCWRFARLALCFALRSPDVQTWQTGNARPVDRPRHSRDRCALACVVVAAGLRPVVRLWSVALLNRKVRPLFRAPCSLHPVPCTLFPVKRSAAPRSAAAAPDRIRAPAFLPVCSSLPYVQRTCPGDMQAFLRPCQPLARPSHEPAALLRMPCPQCVAFPAVAQWPWRVKVL
jgi:hypothetical protein